jgi:hypothetical protein
MLQQAKMEELTVSKTVRLFGMREATNHNAAAATLLAMPGLRLMSYPVK